MENVVDNDAPLDYVEFQLFPNHDRYEACACSGNTIETISSGLLGQLVLHLPRLKDLFSRGSKATFQIQCPENLDSSQWFTKATVTRFLHVVGSVNMLNTTTSILNEITQLEEAKKFHLSLYAKDESETATSDSSKHELLRAMELRLTTLRTELFNAFNRAAGSSCTLKTVADLEKLAQLLGDLKLRNTFRKFLEHSPMDQKIDLPINLSNDTEKKSSEKSQAKKEADLERESSPESDKSCVSSEDDQPSEERSRSFARLASPRRSASPMRRVQIGRSGSRRATALTIKSLSIFPGRDKTQGYRDTDTHSSEEEGSKNKNSETNTQRISVKDAISLFENKQNNHTSEKSRPNLDGSLLRKRTGNGNVSESSSQLNSENVEVKKDDTVHGEIKHEEDAKVDKLYYPIHEKTLKSIDNQPDILVIQHEEDTENLSASSEWNQRKEAELNEMMTKMMQSKPRRNQNRITVAKRTGAQDGPNEKREKLMREKAEKRAEKDAKFIAMQQVLVQRKAAIASTSSTAVMRSKSFISNPEKIRKNSTQILTATKESLKPSVAPSTVRKSWSSTPSPRSSIRGVSPVKTPGGTSSPGPTPTRRKAQPGSLDPQPSPKVERILQKTKPKPSLATPQTESRKRTKGILEKQPPPMLKNEKNLKTKIRPISEKESSKDVAKPSFYNKVTKKSSVVPLESKPSLRKSTGPVVETKASSPPKEPEKNPEITIEVENNTVNIDVIDIVSILDENVESVKSRADVQSEAQLTTHQLSDQIVNCEKVISSSDDCFRRMSGFEVKSEVEEDLTISPTAWIDTEDQEDPYVPPDNNTYENMGPESTASPRIRHSLSQMLLRESELDMAEWGSAEIIPSIVYQKDAPKGLKRLLKFARKSKGDQNSTGWSTPSLFSEGEDDSEELKGFNKRNSDTSLRKVALHASNYGQQKTLHDAGHEIDFAGPQRLSAHLKLNNFSTSNSLLDHNYGATTTNKATRSFFSLSAFRGSKPN